MTNFSGYNLGTEPIWVQSGERKGCKFKKNSAATPMPRGSSLLGQLSHEISHGTLLLVHLSWVGPTTILTRYVGPTNMPRGRATSALSATWQHSSNTPQQAKLHLSDKWQFDISTTKQCKPTSDIWHSITYATSACINTNAGN
jgi:hypothetical protein